MNNGFIRLVSNPVKFKVFLFSKLPAALFSGLRIKEISDERCVVSVPYKWFTKNPFRSTYFASLSMAAELSTGALAMATVYKRKPPVSMLVVGMEASFTKKAVGKTYFTCADGKKFIDAVQSAIDTKQGQIVKAETIGLNERGEEIAKFYFTWSFKSK